MINEETAEPVAVEPEAPVEPTVEAPVDDYFAARRAEIYAEFGPKDEADKPQTDNEEQAAAPEEEEGAPEEEAEAQAAEPEPDEAATKQEERAGKQLVKLIAKEAEFRAKVEEFEAQRKEYEERLAQYEQAQRTKDIDPVGYIKALVSEDKLIDLVEELTMEALGEDAPDEYKGVSKLRKLEREIELLKNGTAGKKEEQEAAPAVAQDPLDITPAEHQAIAAAVTEVDVDTHQSIGRILGAYGDQAVMADMAHIVREYKQANPAGRGMTVDQVFTALDERYGEYLQKLDPPKSKTPAPEPKPTNQTLRNKTTAAQAKESAPDPAVDLEAYNDYVRRQVMEKYGY